MDNLLKAPISVLAPEVIHGVHGLRRPHSFSDFEAGPKAVNDRLTAIILSSLTMSKVDCDRIVRDTLPS